MRVLFVLLSFLLLALAGCTDSGTDEDPTDETGGEITEPTGTETGGEGTGNVTGGPLNMSIPKAIMTISVPAGFAPVNVVFNFSIAGFPDPDFTDWTLDTDGDGTSDNTGFGGLPFNFTQTFTKGGNYTATFEADDGGEAFASVAVNFTVFAEPVIPKVPQDFTGSWLTEDGRCVGNDALGQAGTTHATMTVDEGTWGQTFHAGYASGFLTANVDWEDGSGAIIQSQADTDDGVFYEIAGTVPEGAVTAYFYSCVTDGPNSVDYQTPA